MFGGRQIVIIACRKHLQVVPEHGSVGLRYGLPAASVPPSKRLPAPFHLTNCYTIAA